MLFVCAHLGLSEQKYEKYRYVQKKRHTICAIVLIINIITSENIQTERTIVQINAFVRSVLCQELRSLHTRIWFCFTASTKVYIGALLGRLFPLLNDFLSIDNVQALLSLLYTTAAQIVDSSVSCFRISVFSFNDAGCARVETKGLDEP